jgi:hypothetical protein
MDDSEWRARQVDLNAVAGTMVFEPSRRRLIRYAHDGKPVSEQAASTALRGASAETEVLKKRFFRNRVNASALVSTSSEWRRRPLRFCLSVSTLDTHSLNTP